MKHTKILAAMAALTLASGAQAAANLTSAAVTGASGTVWNTTQDGFFALFLQRPALGNFINPNDEAINASVPDGDSRFFLSGDGFPPGSTGNSDPIYTLTLGFADGATLSGQYNSVNNTFIGGPSTVVGNTTYTLNEFSFQRSLADPVSAFQAVPGGDDNDYAGNFHFSAVAGVVPEPGTWAMMIGGLGFVGGTLRRRATKTKVAFAA